MFLPQIFCLRSVLEIVLFSYMGTERGQRNGITTEEAGTFSNPSQPKHLRFGRTNYTPSVAVSHPVFPIQALMYWEVVLSHIFDVG